MSDDEKTVFTTWEITLNRIEEEADDDEKHVAREVMESISYMEPDRIQTEMFYEKDGSKYNQDQINAS